jgi:Sap, sulfolipid-1-addressing protein
MWAIVLMLALWMAIDPVRLVVATFLISRPRPIKSLFAYWLGGMVGGVASSVGVLIALRDIATPILHDITSFVAACTGGYVRVALGVLALLFAVRIGARMLRREPVGVAMDVAATSAVALQPRLSRIVHLRTALQQHTPEALIRLTTSVWHALEEGSPRVAFVAGLATALPPIEYQAALTTILASGAAIGAQLGASIMFLVLVLAAVEIVLISYVAAPEKTQVFILQLQNWMRAVGGKHIPVSSAVVGVYLVFSGMGAI